jgi:hypothetical protein
MTVGGDGGWCVPDAVYERWRLSKSQPGQNNPRYSGFSDNDILEAAHVFFNEVGKSSVRSFILYSADKFGMPKSYSKWRFAGESSGNGQQRFAQSYCRKYNIQSKDLVYNKSDEHKRKLSEQNKQIFWFSNDYEQASKRARINTLPETWYRGRKYGVKN